VSTQGQDTESQLQAIKTAIEKSGDVLVNVYKDHGISGAKGRDQRPALDQMLNDAKAQKFDKVVVFSIDRLGRSLPDLLESMKLLQDAQVDLQILQSELDTSTAGGRMIFSIFGAISEWERSLIRERVKAGLENAKKNGTRLGRPTNCTPQTEATVKELREKGFSIRKICSLLKISVQKYYDIMKTQAEFSMQN
jgi:DNA invertase Pin-like site-specific DNA recombinase